MTSAKTLASPIPGLPHAPPLVRGLQRVVLRLMGRLSAAERTAERALAVEDRVAIGPRKSLVVVRCHGQRFLVANAGDTIGPIIAITGEITGEAAEEITEHAADRIAASRPTAAPARRGRREREA